MGKTFEKAFPCFFVTLSFDYSIVQVNPMVYTEKLMEKR